MHTNHGKQNIKKNTSIFIGLITSALGLLYIISGDFGGNLIGIELFTLGAVFAGLTLAQKIDGEYVFKDWMGLISLLILATFLYGAYLLF